MDWSQGTSRRRWLQSMGALAALPVVASSGRLHAQSASRTGRTTPPLKIGVASYSLRTFPRDRAIAALKDMGVQYVTIKDVHLARTDTPDQIRAGAKAFTDAGITIMGGGTLTWKQNDEAEIRKDFEYAKAAGFPLMVCSPAPE